MVATLSLLVESYNGSPLWGQVFESYLNKTIMSSSPTRTLVSSPKSSPSDSPPLLSSEFLCRSWPDFGSPVNNILALLR
jgi:hypothetical protein